MKKSKILLLVLILAAVFASCSKDDNKETPSNTEDKSAATGETFAEREKSPVPDDLKFDGQTVRFFSYYPEEGVDTDRMSVKEKDTGDVVNDSIYKRNMDVMDKFGVIFEFTYSPPGAAGNYPNDLISKAVAAGMDDYEIVIGNQYQCVQLATKGVYKNLINLPYLDITNKWWATQYINDLTIGKDVLMYVTGDISLSWLVRLSAVYFNKKLYADNFGQPDDFYQLVLDGKWTLDELNTMVKSVYRDLDGDGAPGEDDQYGMIGHTYSTTDLFTYSSGVRATARDENGLPYFVFNNEKTVRYTEKLYDIFYGGPGMFLINVAAIPEFDRYMNDKFAANKVLFRADVLVSGERLRNMETDFGIIPFPKFDENEPSYLALVHDVAPLLCIPLTCEKDELAGAVLEEMAFRGYMDMTPAFFDVALKNKYMRDSDDKAMQCLDIIRINAMTDFAYVYNYALNNVGLIMRDLMTKKSSNFVSAYEKTEDKANKSLQKIIEAYMG